MGGTFDPVHFGHLRTALEIQQWLGVPCVHLIPSHRSVHRDQPKRSAEHRLHMVERAIADEPALLCDPREVQSDQPSYSIYTLEALRKELGTQVPVCMVIGMDSFLGLEQWYRYEDLLRLGHLIVVARPGVEFAPTPALEALLQAHQTSEHVLLTTPAGGIVVHELTPLSISATQIRGLIAQGKSPRYLLPETVLNYIQDQHLYQEQNKGE